MSRLLVSPHVVFGLILSVLFLGGASCAAQEQAGSRPGSTIELKCKIVGVPGDPAHVPWLIELRNAVGQPLRRALRMVGDTVHFKNLMPGIYRICLTGRQGCNSYVSVDLTPAPGQKSLEIEKEVRVPGSAERGPGQYAVNVRALSVPREAVQELQRSEKAQLEGDRDGVVHHLERAVEICPDYADAWNNLGAYYHRIGDYAQSIRTFTKVTELNPEFYLGWMNLGGSLLATGRFKEAVEANKKALSLGPNDAVVNSQLGLSYYYLHDYAKAKKHFKRVLDLDPAYANSPQLYLVHIALANNAPAEAIGYLRSYLEYHPNSPEAPKARKTLADLSEGTIIIMENKKYE